MFFCETWKKVLIAATMVVALCAPQAHASKDVVLAIASTLTTTDPWDANDTLSHACAKTFYEGLFGFNEKLELRPVLAESYDVSPDGLVYTFHLRKGVKFHDGTDFNAEAVKVNFDRVTNPENKLKRYSLYSNIAKTEVVDDLTAKVTLKTPFSPFINQLAHPSAVMISPTALKKYGKDIMFHPVGTGPYKFVEWKQTDYLKGAKNENYWRPGLPKIDTITWVPVVDNNARSAMMRTGEAHFTFPVPYEQAAVLEKDEHLKLVAAPSIVTRYLNMNMLQKPFDDLRVRQAINYALNQQEIIDVVLEGRGQVANSVMNVNIPGYSEEITGYSQDLEKAKALMAEAGYPDGFKTTLFASGDVRNREAQIIQAQLLEIGIEVDIQLYEWGAFLDAINKGEHDMFISSWSNATMDPDASIFPLFHTKNFGATGNRAFYSNPEVDTLIEQAQKESDNAKRMELYKEIQQKINDDAPWVCLFYGTTCTGIRADLKGFVLHPSSANHYENLYYEK